MPLGDVSLTAMEGQSHTLPFCKRRWEKPSPQTRRAVPTPCGQGRRDLRKHPCDPRKICLAVGGDVIATHEHAGGAPLEA